MTATVVLVHGAWHGAWCWEKVVSLLDDAGVPSIALDLPGHGDDDRPLTDLAGDAAALSEVLDQLTDPVVCGHSYGGCVVTEGVADRSARHLVFLAAFPMLPGESAVNAAADAPRDPDPKYERLGTAMRIDDNDIVTVDDEWAIPLFFADCDPDDAAKARDRLCPQSMAELRGIATHGEWQRLPSTYVVCTDDLAVPPTLQRALAQRCTHTFEWPTSHSPFLSRPQLVADLLIELATG